MTEDGEVDETFVGCSREDKRARTGRRRKNVCGDRGGDQEKEHGPQSPPPDLIRLSR